MSKWKKPEYNEAEVLRLFVELMANGANQKINYFGVGILVANFKQIQRYFCNLSELIELETAKKRLAKLIGVELLVNLEGLFPEIMQIGGQI